MAVYTHNMKSVTIEDVYFPIDDLRKTKKFLDLTILQGRSKDQRSYKSVCVADMSRQILIVLPVYLSQKHSKLI